MVTSELDSLGLLYRQPAALRGSPRGEKDGQEESRACPAPTRETIQRLSSSAWDHVIFQRPATAISTVSPA